MKSKTNKQSKKHHYLPVFYLKGFTDDNGLLCVYDKVRDTMLTKQKPESKFYENNLNNYVLNGEIQFSFEETVFKPLDTKGAQIFNKIRNTKYVNEVNLSIDEKFDLLSFIFRLFWRLPDSNNYFIELIKKEGIANKHFQITIKDEKQPLSEEQLLAIKDEILSNSEIQKMMKHYIPVTQGAIEEIEILYQKWKIYSMLNKSKYFITGDYPFLINNNDFRIDNVFNELIIPIGKHKAFSFTAQSSNFVDEPLVALINVSILHQAKRFIASNNEENLRCVIDDYNRIAQTNREKNIVKETFNFIGWQSKFTTYNEYYKAYMAEFRS